jgi:hypothetical protein
MLNFKQVSLFLAVIMLSMLSCKTSDNNHNLICGTANPLEDLPWLKQIKEVMAMNTRMAGSQIIRYSYKGEDVFWIDMCYNCADDLVSVRNCQGDVICEFGGIAGLNNCPDFHSQASDSTMLFDNVQH